MKYLFVFLSILISFAINATVYKVGDNQLYKTPNELYIANVISDGDIIEIDHGDYSGDDALAIWSKNDLIIRGVSGRPHLLASGKYIQGKGIWVISGRNVTVDNIEFSGSKVPDKNGAGIRAEGIGITIRNCFFHDNENGILTSNPYDGDVVIEYCEFARNGYGDGYTHNLYVGHVNSLTFSFNYSHHAKVGQNLKSRAQNNFIKYNRIMDEDTGNSSRLIDLPNGGFALIIGNLLMQGPDAENNNLVGYGSEGLSNNSPHEFYFINNTCVNKRTASCRFLTVKEGTDKVEIINNIFAGSGAVLEGQSALLQNSIVFDDISDAKFIDEANYDYHLQSGSPAIDYGKSVEPINNHTLIPKASYNHTCTSENRDIVGASIDAGAYEFGVPLLIRAIQNAEHEEVSIFPNPINQDAVLEFELRNQGDVEVNIFDLRGHLLKNIYKGFKYVGKQKIMFNVEGIATGLYNIEIQTTKIKITKKIIVLKR